MSNLQGFSNCPWSLPIRPRPFWACINLPINGVWHSHFTEEATETRRDLAYRDGRQGLARPRESPPRLNLSFSIWATGHLTLRKAKSSSGANQKGVSVGGEFLGASGPAQRPHAPHQRPRSGHHSHSVPYARTLRTPATSGHGAAAASGKRSFACQPQRPLGSESPYRSETEIVVPPRKNSFEA